MCSFTVQKGWPLKTGLTIILLNVFVKSEMVIILHIFISDIMVSKGISYVEGEGLYMYQTLWFQMETIL